jgi:hypothetical protein
MVEGEVCVAFLGPKEIQKRLTFGVVMGLATFATLAGVLSVDAAPRLARAVVFLPAVMAGFGVFQAREKT